MAALGVLAAEPAFIDWYALGKASNPTRYSDRPHLIALFQWTIVKNLRGGEPHHKVHIVCYRWMRFDFIMHQLYTEVSITSCFY